VSREHGGQTWIGTDAIIQERPAKLDFALVSASRSRAKRNDSGFVFLLEASNLRSKLVRGGTQRVVGKVSVAFGRCRRRVP
jgi:hypothetical protein